MVSRASWCTGVNEKASPDLMNIEFGLIQNLNFEHSAGRGNLVLGRDHVDHNNEAELVHLTAREQAARAVSTDQTSEHCDMSAAC